MFSYLFTFVILLKELHDECSHTNRNDGCNKARQLEAVIDYILAHTCRSRAVEVDCCHLGRVVWQEEIAIASGEHRHQEHGIDAQGYAHRIECCYGCGLREEHNAHDEQRHCEQERCSGNYTRQGIVQVFLVAEIESAAHPRNTEDGYNGIHTCFEYVSIHCIACLCLADKEYDCSN